MVKFFDLVRDFAVQEPWFLSTPVKKNGREVDSRLFTEGKTVDISSPLNLPLRREGKEVSFNFCDFDMIVTPKNLNLELEKELGDLIQRIPIEVKGCDQEFEILNILDTVECIDETKSEFLKWNEKDNRLDRLGDYRAIYELYISEEAAKGHKMFRIKGWEIAVIVDEDIKQLIIDHGTTGVVFQPVN